MEQTTLSNLSEELGFLLIANKDILSKVDFTGKSLPQIFFNNLVEKYYGQGSYSKASFEKATGYGKRVYYRLNGYDVLKEVKPEQVIAAMFWLQTTYEEAKLLFLLIFVRDMEITEFQKWDTVLQELNKSERYLKNVSAGKRVLYARNKIDEL